MKTAVSSPFPTDPVTFLFTDIEGSTRLLQELGDAATAHLFAEHRELLRAAFARHQGDILETQGDAFLVAFPIAREAVLAAIEGVRAINAYPWPDGVTLRVRIGIHTGEAAAAGGALFGLGLHRAARICGAGWGGQVLLSQSAVEAVAGGLPLGAVLRDLGEHRLKDLQRPERIYQLLYPELPGDFPPLRTLSVLPTNLPVQLSSFIGREKEIAEVKDLIARARLVTLTGVGGTGKTRLALQAAADLIDDLKDGVWLVELASLADAALVPQAVASVMTVREQPGRALTETLVDSLQGKRVLLLIDNCEHLVAACAQLADILLRRCQDVRILTTSREPLAVTGETVFPVSGLSLPDAQRFPSLDSLMESEAVRLFVERATAADPTFRLTKANAASVANVCARLDGVPLAIELAAARVRSLQVDEIARRLDDRFRLLTSGSRVAVPRQRTLRAAIDWSYDLLTEPERALLARLSVFAGGFTLAAAEGVCPGDEIDEADILDLVSRLVDKSLVVVDQQDSGDRRYRLLETVRQYAHERLGEVGKVDETRDRHLDYFVALAETAEPGLYWGPEEIEWLKRLEKDLGNLRAAMDWSKASVGGVDKGLRLVSAIWWLWGTLGYLSEARGYVESLLSRGVSTSSIRAKAINALGCLRVYMGEEFSIRPLFEESLALYRELGDKAGIAEALNNLGLTVGLLGDPALGRTLLEECIALSREIGHTHFVARAMEALGGIMSSDGDFAAARSLTEEALAISRPLGNGSLISTAYFMLGNIGTSEGNYPAALSSYRDCLRVRRELGDRYGIVDCLSGLADVYAALEQSQKAGRLFGSTAALYESGGVLPPIFLRDRREATQASLRSILGEDAFQAASAEGRAMPTEQVIEYALSDDE